MPAGRGKNAERGQAATHVPRRAGRAMSKGKRVFSAWKNDIRVSGSCSSPSEDQAAHVLCRAGATDAGVTETLAVGVPCFTHAWGPSQGSELLPGSRAHIWLPVAGCAHLEGKAPFFSQGVRFKKLIRF